MNCAICGCSEHCIAVDCDQQQPTAAVWSFYGRRDDHTAFLVLAVVMAAVSLLLLYVIGQVLLVFVIVVVISTNHCSCRYCNLPYQSTIVRAHSLQDQPAVAPAGSLQLQ